MQTRPPSCSQKNFPLDVTSKTAFKDDEVAHAGSCCLQGSHSGAEWQKPQAGRITALLGSDVCLFFSFIWMVFFFLF